MYQIITRKSTADSPKVTPDMIFFCIKLRTIFFNKYVSKSDNKTSDISQIKLFRAVDDAKKYILENNIDGEIRHIDPLSMRIV